MLSGLKFPVGSIFLSNFYGGILGPVLKKITCIISYMFTYIFPGRDEVWTPSFHTSAQDFWEILAFLAVRSIV